MLEEDEGLSIADQLIDEGLERVTDVLRRAGIRVSPWTAIRWARRGVKGKRLDAVKVGGVWMTTDAAVRRFLATRPERAAVTTVRRPIRDGEGCEAVERYLEDVGLGRSGN